jgi:hypothetical protein
MLPRAAWADLIELAAVGATAVGLAVAAVAVLVVDEPAVRRAVGSSAQSAPTAEAPRARGRMLFQTVGCVGCHLGPDGLSGGVQAGPDLRRLRDVAGGRRTGMSAAAYVRESIRDPDAFRVPEFEGIAIAMPRFDLSDGDVDALVAFLLASDAPELPAEGAGQELPSRLLPPRIESRSFDPSPPGTAYPTVWLGDDVTMLVTFAEGSEPSALVTHFVDDDGHGSMTITVRAERVATRTWRARFAMPRVGRWEGRHELAGASPPPFALRVIRPGS